MPAAAIRSLFLEGPAGRLETLVNAGAADARFCALVTHPHPLYGGTMHNKVVFHAMKALNTLGLPALRFNFRGTGASGGAHGGGVGEVDDVRCALDWLSAEFALPILFAGFSFGAYVGLKACCADSRVIAAIALGCPVNAEGREYGYPFLADCAKPKLLVSGERDEFASPAALAEIARSAADPKRLVLIPHADHYFTGHLEEMREAVGAWTRELLPRL